MSLLWVTAQSGEWYERGRADLATGNRQKKQVMDAHGVPDFRAGIALRTVRNQIRTSQGDDPADFGFKNPPDDSDDETYPPRLLNHKAWHSMEPQDVSLRTPLHATQWEMDPQSVAHNLFHPGKPHPNDLDEVGNPDHDPASDPGLPDTPHVRTDLPRLYRNAQGQHHVVDGHHRLAADLLLKKPTTKALVWDESNPPEGAR